MIVSKNEPVTLIGGAEVEGDDLDLALARAPNLVAADSGADRALALGHSPEAVIGDLDSLTDKGRAAIPDDRLHLISEQDSTDFEKALREISAPLVIGLGFMGGRMDHQMAVFNALVQFPKQRCLLLGSRDVVFLCPPSFRLDLEEGTTVSLFPLGAVEGVSDGLLWPIGGLYFAPDGRVGTSNIATGTIDVAFTAPKMLMMLPRACFGDVAEALLNTSAHWHG